MEFPATAEEFYRLRDDRTNLYTGSSGYQMASVRVTIDPDLVKRYRGQIMLVATCNLLSRWCRSVRIEIPPSSLPADKRIAYGELPGILIGQMQDADPFGDFQVLSRVASDAKLQLHIGSYRPEFAGSVVVINCDGWYAAIGQAVQRLHDSGSDVVIGAIGAACIGVAQLFKRALGLGENVLTEDGVFDLFALRRVGRDETLSPRPDLSTTNLGRILMVGAGSVGSAAAYWMRLAQLACELTIVDGDVVKVVNFNRSPIFGRANFGRNKAEAVTRGLAGSKMNVNFFPGWWDDFAKKSGGVSGKFDLWLPLANDFGVRWSMQQNLPPLLIHASTGANWNANHGRHIAGRDDCLADRFPSEVTKDALACSTARIQVKGGNADAALPFLSMFAGLLITSDLMRLQIVGYPQVPNFALFDFLGPMSGIQAWDRSPRPDCGCQRLSPDLYREINGKSRYSYLAFPH